MYFPSRKDLWPNLIIWLSIIFTLIMFLLESIWYGALSIIPVILLWSWAWFTTGYTITDTELRAQSGPFHWRINLEAIQKVRRTNNPLSSPALSLKRLEIVYANGQSLLISPADIVSFINVLKQCCPRADIHC